MSKNKLGDRLNLTNPKSLSLTRRQFGVASVSATVVATIPRTFGASEISSANISVSTPDGEADCYFTHPSEGVHPAVILWPDAMGLRPAFEQMAQRLAGSGYSVLVINPYYRKEPAPIVPLGTTFRDPIAREKVFPLMRSLTPENNVTDAKALIEFLDGQDVVAEDRKMGTIGYCMGGAMTMRTAALSPDRIGAGASFHGGRLVTSDEASPHHLVQKMQASYLVAIAEDDDAREPESKNVLRTAFSDTNLDAEIEVYAGTQHGWCPIDSSVYHHEQAERAWQRMLALFNKSLS